MLKQALGMRKQLLPSREALVASARQMHVQLLPLSLCCITDLRPPRALRSWPYKHLPSQSGVINVCLCGLMAGRVIAQASSVSNIPVSFIIAHVRETCKQKLKNLTRTNLGPHRLGRCRKRLCKLYPELNADCAPKRPTWKQKSELRSTIATSCRGIADESADQPIPVSADVFTCMASGTFA